MIIHELWSSEDDARADVCARAMEARDLTEALLAIEAAPPDTVRHVRSQLSGWGRALAGRLRSNSQTKSAAAASRDDSPAAQARALASYLGDELDLRGDVDDYYNARNSRLSEVIRRHRGLPILLSAIWIEVGAVAGLEVEGVGMPGHFVARVGGDDGQLCDPFGGGRLLGVEDCKRIVREMSQGKLAWQDSHLAAMPAHQMVERVLANLVQAHTRTEDKMALYRTLTLLAKLRPEVPGYCLKRAAAAETLGARGHAAQIYAEVVRRYPGSQEAAVAAERHQAANANHGWN